MSNPDSSIVLSGRGVRTKVMFVGALYIKFENFANYNTEKRYLCIHVDLNCIMDAISFKSINNHCE